MWCGGGGYCGCSDNNGQYTISPGLIPSNYDPNGGTPAPGKKPAGNSDLPNLFGGKGCADPTMALICQFLQPQLNEGSPQGRNTISWNALLGVCPDLLSGDITLCPSLASSGGQQGEGSKGSSSYYRGDDPIIKALLDWWGLIGRGLGQVRFGALIRDVIADQYPGSWTECGPSEAETL